MMLQPDTFADFAIEHYIYEAKGQGLMTDDSALEKQHMWSSDIVA